MKRTYIKPAVEVVDIETMATCDVVKQSWHVNGDNYDPDTDHGYIIEDKNDGSLGKDDPWDSTNW